MRRVKIVFFLLLVNVTFTTAQINPGAKEIATGSANVAISDNAMALYGNPAGSAQINWKEFSVYYAPSYFGLKELATASAAASVPLSFGVISGGFLTYGFNLYKETTVSISFSKVFFKRIMFGLSVDYKSLKIARYGNAASILFNAGGIIYLFPQVRLGFSIRNFTRSTYKNHPDQIPSIISVGASFNPTEEITLNIALSKDMDYPLSTRFGLEYGIFKNLDLRFGYRTEPNSYTGGLGIKYKYFELDYAFFTHEELPLSHQVSLIIALKDITLRRKMIADKFDGK